MSIRSIADGYFERSFDPKTVEETREMDFIISTNDRDRHRTRLNPDNWQLENYALNPIVMYNHQGYADNPFIKSDPDDIIAKSVVNIDTVKGCKVLASRATFESKDINNTAEKVFRKLIFGSLRAVSVGFVEIGKGKIVETKDANGIGEKTYHFEGQELLEWSVVHVPSNAKAGARSLVDYYLNEIVHIERLIECGKNEFKKNDFLNMTVSDVISDLRKMGNTEAEIEIIIEKPGADPKLNTYAERLLKLKK